MFKIFDMRNDIHKDGVSTQLSSTNQPAKRGRPKGSKNRRKIFEELLCVKFDDNSDQAEYLRKTFPNLPKNLSVYELLNMKLLEAALGGNIKAIQQINEKADGKPLQQQKIEVSEEKVDPSKITSRIYTVEELDKFLDYAEEKEKAQKTAK